MAKSDEDSEKQRFLKEQVAARPVVPIDGSIVHYDAFPSAHVRPRPVDVWLPEGYDVASADRFPVVYMHDGQLLFHVDTSPFAGLDLFWDVDKAITRLSRTGEITPAIVVSVWMPEWAPGARGAEYMPQKAVDEAVWRQMQEQGWGDKAGADELSGDNYLRFLVDELKPFIDETYKTQSDRDHTFIMGSSMGGLISAYAMAEYPDVYGGTACLSTDWTIGEGAVVRWLADHWPFAGAHRVYFDHGTATYDASYGPYQAEMDEVMRRYGYRDGVDWTSRCFEGADHSPKAWRERLHVPLKFLLGEPRDP